MGIGKQIRARREELGFTQLSLASRLGVTKAAVANYENGVSHPKEAVLYRLFSVLGCDANFLFKGLYPETASAQDTSLSQHIALYKSLDQFGREMVDTILQKECERQAAAKSAPASPKPAAPIRIIPLFELPVSAGTGVYLESSDSEGLAVADTGIASRADFALRVRGDSMMPLYSDGDCLLVKEQPSVEPGQLGIFQLDGEGYFKKFGGNRLISLNPQYEDIPIPFGGDISCRGLVLGKLDPS